MRSVFAFSAYDNERISKIRRARLSHVYVVRSSAYRSLDLRDSRPSSILALEADVIDARPTAEWKVVVSEASFAPLGLR